MSKSYENTIKRMIELMEIPFSGEELEKIRGSMTFNELWNNFVQMCNIVNEKNEEIKRLKEQPCSHGKENKETLIKSDFDTVSNPSHYCEGRKYEPKDVIRDWELNFNLGSALKYVSRAGRKDDIVQDLQKAKQFIQFEIDYLKSETR